MFKSVAILAVIALAAVSAGVIETHTVLETTIGKVGTVVHSVPSTVSHQSFTRAHNNAVVSDIVAPVVKTVQVAPLIKTVPLQHVAVAPVVKSVHVAPFSQVHYTAPVVSAYAASPVYHTAPVVHAAPVLKTVVSPIAYAVHH